MVYSGSFFEVSAQLIPVLFLAMVVEEKFQPDSEETPSDRVGRSWLFVSLVIGELLALSVIAGGLSPSKGVGGLVASSMLFAAFLMALPVISRELKEGRSRRERLGHALAGLAVLVAVLLDNRGHTGVVAKNCQHTGCSRPMRQRLLLHCRGC